MISEIIEEASPEGVCFFCGNYYDSISAHETKVHGANRIRQNELY